MIVLNYHQINEGAPDCAWSMPTVQFRRQIEMASHRLISPAAFLAKLDDPTASRSTEVVLTFDDAFLSDYIEVFARHMAAGKVPGFFSFIPVHFIGRPGHLTWEMVDEMHRHRVVIGSHGLDHIDLTRADDDKLNRELAGSKARLEDRIGGEVADFAFPYGRFSRRVWREALSVGYRRLHTIQLGHHQGFEPFLISRLCLQNGLTDSALLAHLNDPDSARGKKWRWANRLGLYRIAMQLRYGFA